MQNAYRQSVDCLFFLHVSRGLIPGHVEMDAACRIGPSVFVVVRSHGHLAKPVHEVAVNIGIGFGVKLGSVEI